jgi:uncharacterized RDD family membrane protein YckC
MAEKKKGFDKKKGPKGNDSKEKSVKQYSSKEKEIHKESMNNSLSQSLVSPKEITGSEPNVNPSKATIQNKATIQKPKSLLGTNALISKRILAFILDFIIISLLVLPAYLPVAKDYEGLSFEEISQRVENDEYLLMLPFYTGIIAFFYFTLLEFSFSQTFGKKAFGIYVVSLSGKMTFSKALLRSFILLDLPFFGILRAFDFVYALFNPNNQRLLEQFSKTKSIQFYALNKEGINQAV